MKRQLFLVLTITTFHHSTKMSSRKTRMVEESSDLNLAKNCTKLSRWVTMDLEILVKKLRCNNPLCRSCKCTSNNSSWVVKKTITAGIHTLVLPTWVLRLETAVYSVTIALDWWWSPMSSTMQPRCQVHTPISNTSMEEPFPEIKVEVGRAKSNLSKLDTRLSRRTRVVQVRSTGSFRSTSREAHSDKTVPSRHLLNRSRSL